MTYEYMTGMGDAGTLFRLNILNFGPSVGRSCTKESTNACCQTAMAMPDAELARVAAPYAAWSGLSSQGRQGNYMELLTAMQEWRRSTPCPDEIANEYKDRRIEANMDEAGRTAAVKGAMFWGLSARLWDSSKESLWRVSLSVPLVARYSAMATAEPGQSHAQLCGDRNAVRSAFG
jgi:hypothetical protein